VANLMLARGAARAREIAVRAAIGAGRGRIVRQLLTESLVLGFLGGALGLTLSVWGIKLIVAMSPDGIPRLDEVRLDLPTVLFAIALSIVSAVLSGLVPALRLARADLHSTLKEGGRGVGTAVRDRLRRSLVVAEVALSLVLLTGAGLLIRSAIALQRVEPGFDPAHVFSAAMTLPRTTYSAPDVVVRTYDNIREQVKRVTGVESSALVFSVPMFGANATAGVNPEGRPQDASGQISVGLHIASPGVFQTLKIPMKAGRDFNDRDVVGAPRAVIINEAAAKAAWPKQNPIGKRLGLLRDSAGGPLWWEVVGVVGDTRDLGPRQDAPAAMYMALAQTPPVILNAIQQTLFVVARVRGEPLTFTRPIQRAIAEVDRSLPLFAISSMEQRLADSLAGARFNTALLSVLGAIGLVLAMVGIFGVISYFVSQRTQEIGLRMALGASPRRVLVLVVEQGLRPVVLGVIIGLAGAVGATRLLQTLLYGVSPTDPLTMAGVALGVTLVAIVAAMLPARRATRIDPLVALRE
jgi:predicted permease